MLDKAWYLLYTKPQQEEVAVRNLEQQHYSVYLPYLTEKKRMRGVVQDVTCPMFPRYLFIELSQKHDNWSPIRSTRGVSGLVRFGLQPACVPTDLIERLQANANRLSDWAMYADRFNAGDKVTMIDGAFKGYEMIFQAQKGTERAIVLLDIASQHTQLQVNIDELEQL